MKEFRYGDKADKAPFPYTMSGLDDIYLVSGYELTETDYGPGVVIHNIDGLHRAIGDYLAEFKKTLSGKEVRFLRHEMDLTQAELGDLLRVTDQTVARWEKGEVNIPGPEELLVRVFYVGHVSKQVDVRSLVEHLRAMDSPTNEKLLFAPSNGAWHQIAA
jgi:putative transcriptional regulator